MDGRASSTFWPVLVKIRRGVFVRSMKPYGQRSAILCADSAEETGVSPAGARSAPGPHEIANDEIKADKHHERDKPLIPLGRTVRDDKHAAVGRRSARIPARGRKFLIPRGVILIISLATMPPRSPGGSPYRSGRSKDWLKMKNPAAPDGEARGRGGLGLRQSKREDASMANDEHVALLKQGVTAWNASREKNPDIRRPDLAGADLSGANLDAADLRRAAVRAENLDS